MAREFSTWPDFTVQARRGSVLGIERVTLALPHFVGNHGSVATIPLGMNAEDQAALQRSATILQSAIGSLPS